MSINSLRHSAASVRGFSFAALLTMSLVAGQLLLASSGRAAHRLAATTSSGTTTHGISVRINCAQGQVDQRHRVTVTVARQNQDGSTTWATVTEQVPEQSTVQDVALGLATKLSIKCGAEIQAQGEGLERTIDLPDGWVVEEVKTHKKVGKRWKETKGHLRVSSNARKSGSGVLPAPLGFESFILQISESDAAPLAVYLEITAARSNGLNATWNYEPTYPVGTPLPHIMEDLAAQLQNSFGLVVEFLGATALRAVPQPGQAIIVYVNFAAYENNDHGSITDPDADTPPWTVVTRLTVDT